MNQQTEQILIAKIDRLVGAVNEVSVKIEGLTQRADITLADHDKRLTKLERIELGNVGTRLDKLTGEVESLKRDKWVFAGVMLALTSVISLFVQLAPVVLDLK